MKNITWIKNERSCGECSKCCEGWISGEAYGHKFYKGCPCFFLEKTCSIYDLRPNEPCKSYKCAWLEEEIFPLWLKPSMSNVIITKRYRKLDNREIYYYAIDETGKKIDSSVLNWLILFALNKNVNILYRIDGGPNRIGSNEFLSLDL